MTEDILENTKFKAKQVDRKLPKWTDEYRPHWKLIFTYKDTKVKFNFWNNLQNEIPKKYESLDIILGDGLSGLMTLEQFCCEFGYSDDSIKARKAWKSCGKTTLKLCKLFRCMNSMLYTLSDSVHDKIELEGV